MAFIGAERVLGRRISILLLGTEEERIYLIEMGSWFSRIFSFGWRILERGMVAVGGVAARTAMVVVE